MSARADGIPLVYVKPFAYSWPHLRQSPALPVLQGRGRLARAVNSTAPRLLRETARHTRARDLREHLAHTDGARTAADHIDALIRR